MKTLTTAVLGAALLISLTACGSPAPQHASIEDCMATYTDKGLSTEDLTTVCTRILDKVGQAEFDETYND